MRYVIRDAKYRFHSAFDTVTGAYVRTGILDDSGNDTGIDPFMASYPHLIDVGIMGHCIHGKTGLCAKAGIGCYQSGLLVEKPNMSVENFRWIAEQSKGKCNQSKCSCPVDSCCHQFKNWWHPFIKSNPSSSANPLFCQKQKRGFLSA